jgi:hypothetical protein
MSNSSEFVRNSSVKYSSPRVSVASRRVIGYSTTSRENVIRCTFISRGANGGERAKHLDIGQWRTQRVALVRHTIALLYWPCRRRMHAHTSDSAFGIPPAVDIDRRLFRVRTLPFVIWPTTHAQSYSLAGRTRGRNTRSLNLRSSWSVLLLAPERSAYLLL